MRKTRKVVVVLWCAQVDEEVDGGSGAPKLGDARKTKQKGTEGKKK